MSADVVRDLASYARDALVGLVDLPHEMAIDQGVGYALLALREELRTANLIAYLDHAPDPERISPDIRARLGLTEDGA